MIFNFNKKLFNKKQTKSFLYWFDRPTMRENVLDGCPSQSECQQSCPATAHCIAGWGNSRCECESGYVGGVCVPVCSTEPCENTGTCVEDRLDVKGYRCQCNSSDYSGEELLFKNRLWLIKSGFELLIV